MENFFSKISLYDFLTTVLFGACLSFVFDGCTWLESFDSENFWVNALSCYLVGLVAHKMVELVDFSRCNCCRKEDKCKFLSIILSSICRNQVSMINDARKEVGVEVKEEDSAVIMTEYYQTYYNLMDKKKLYNIPTLEAHSAFLKDMIFVFIILIIKFIFCSSSIVLIGCVKKEWVAFLILLLLLILLVGARYNTEYKIHRLVWEGKKYNIQ